VIRLRGLIVSWIDGLLHGVHESSLESTSEGRTPTVELETCDEGAMGLFQRRVCSECF
jgi:hypothetical protein